MSGHSHWASIKHQKGAADAKRGKVFSKITKSIAVAAREGGSDPGSNSKLRMAIEQAKTLNMPKDNIERAIKKGTGELGGEKLEQVTFGAYGPGKIAIIIEGITDNKNRTLGEIKQILSQNRGKLAGEGSVRWLFERKGAITINFQFPPAGSGIQKKEEIELKAIEAGAEDIYWHDDILDIYTKPEELEKVKNNLEEKEIKIDSSSLDWVPKEMINIEKKEKEACQKLFEELDENNDVQDIYSNLAT